MDGISLTPQLFVARFLKITNFQIVTKLYWVLQINEGLLGHRQRRLQAVFLHLFEN